MTIKTAVVSCGYSDFSHAVRLISLTTSSPIQQAVDELSRTTTLQKFPPSMIFERICFSNIFHYGYRVRMTCDFRYLWTGSFAPYTETISPSWNFLSGPLLTISKSSSANSIHFILSICSLLMSQYFVGSMQF